MDMVGRNSGLVEFVFCSFDRGCCFFARGIWLADTSPDKGDSGDEAMDDRTDGSWTMGGRAGLRCDWEVGDPRGVCEGDEKGLLWTYDCLGSWNVFSRSSWCTATLKRFQNWGSRTILGGITSGLGGRAY
jgi:hypothetical protein